MEVAELERHNAKLAAVGEGHARASAGERARADRWRRLCLAERVPVWVGRFDRRGIEPVVLFTSEFGQNSFKIQCILLGNSKTSEIFNINFSKVSAKFRENFNKI